MLIINEKLWLRYKIIYVSSDHNWDQHDTLIMLECTLKKIENQLKNLSTECAVVLDSNNGNIPFQYQMTIIRWLISISNLIEKKIKFSIIYCTNNNHKTWIDAMFKLYTPIKPVYIVQKEEELVHKLKEYAKEEFKI
tara:strand:- start:19 stop:429 length:411 start_codon:yes stop_codon:yes gene_type:complete